MRAHGVLGDEEPLCDLVGSKPLVEEKQHLDLARAQKLRDRFGDAAVGRAPVADLLEQSPRDRARERGLAASDAAEELDDPLRRFALQQVAGGPGTDRLEEVLLRTRRREHDDFRGGRGVAELRERRQAVEPRHREVEQDEIRLERARELDRLGAVPGLSDDVEPVLDEQRGERLARQRMVVHDQYSVGHFAFLRLSARRVLPTRVNVRYDDRDAYQAWLWGEVLLFGLLGAALALFIEYPTLQQAYDLPALRLVIDTAIMLAGAIVAVLAGIRFSVDGRRFDLLLSCGFFAGAATTLAFAIAPVVGGDVLQRSEAWAGVGGRLLATALIAAAPFARGRFARRERALGNALVWLVVVLGAVWLGARAAGDALPALGGVVEKEPPFLLTSALAVQALLSLLALIGFGARYRDGGQDLDRWLASAATLMLFSSLHQVFTPLLSSAHVSQGDFLRVLAYGVLLVVVWRAISSAEFGRAVAEERARVAREIHDGLAQYLFAIATHASMLEADGAKPQTVAQIKELATSAQHEARFAVLALSSAGGTAPFDAALRRYVEFLTADGALEVDVEIDPRVRLAPDEQIEVFRIVQEGLANVRKHAGARSAEVRLVRRAGQRVVVVSDDGEGFEEREGGAGQGLRNIRDRAASIDGAANVRSRVGHGTTLEIALRT